MEKTRISIVSYLNSKPFLYGIQQKLCADDIKLTIDIPSKVAAKLAYHQVDMGLIPVAGLDDLESYKIISDYCIGTTGKVKTVILASEVPLEKIDTILMDYQSRSSVLLAKVLSKFYWKKQYNWENTCNNFHNTSIKGNKAGVVIGDRVFGIEDRYPYCYDLGEEWVNFTGLPFVFAVWASTKELPKAFQQDFNIALKYGIEHFSEVIQFEKKNYPNVDIQDYFLNNISFNFDEKKRRGMKKFLELAKKTEPVELT